MAACFWRSVLGIALLFVVVAATAVSLACSLSFIAASGLALAMLLLGPLGLVLLSMLMARTLTEPVAAPIRVAGLLRAALGETLDFSRAILAMSVERRPSAPTAGIQRPVLLIHGILCNRAVWGNLPERLRAAGFGPVVAVDLEPLLADIEQQAPRAQAELLQLRQRSSGARVLIVAHSMGGLVARVLLRNLGAEAIARIITVATPHHGTRLAAALPWPATRQLTTTSPWLRALNAAQEGRFAVPVVSLYSREDNLVVPAGSARLAGAELREYRGLGHFSVLRAPRALDGIMAAVSGAGAP
jgi:pimeloyl-ACP methyl ester carboxylesterase